MYHNILIRGVLCRPSFASPDSQLHFREELKQTPPCESSVAPQHFCPVSPSPFRLGSPWQRHLAHVCERNSSFKTQQPLHRASRRAGHAMAAAPSSHSTVHFSAKLETDIPFLENAEVPFEAFLEDRERVFAAFFPDEDRRERLSNEVWRIYMLPVGFFFLSVRPVVDMRLWMKEQPPLVALQAIKYELRGADVREEDFILGVDGSLFAERDRGSGGARLRGSMGVSVQLTVPDALMLVAPGAIETMGSGLLHQLLDGMRNQVNTRVLNDYRLFAREQQNGRRRRWLSNAREK